MDAVKIIVCGDFRAANPNKIQLDNKIGKLLESADLKVCNFEAPVHVEGVKPIKKSGPALDQSVESPSVLKRLGFNVILLANNHVMDYGKEGLRCTVDSFNDVITVGAGSAQEAFSVRLVEIKGRRIGLLSLVQREFGTVESKDDEGYGAAWIGSPDVPGVLIEAKKQCDYLFVFPHAGVEHTDAPLPGWRRLYKHFIDWGADAVVASHPHCPQGWETYHGKPIFYSLGDFYFDELSYDDLWYKSIMVELSIGETIEVNKHYICFDDKTGSISIDNSDRINSFIESANNLLCDASQYDKYMADLSNSYWNGYKYSLLRGICGISFQLRLKLLFRLAGCMLLCNKDELTLLNAIQCESHRWLAEMYIRNNNK